MRCPTIVFSGEPSCSAFTKMVLSWHELPLASPFFKLNTTIFLCRPQRSHSLASAIFIHSLIIPTSPAQRSQLPPRAALSHPRHVRRQPKSNPYPAHLARLPNPPLHTYKPLSPLLRRPATTTSWFRLPFPVNRPQSKQLCEHQHGSTI